MATPPAAGTSASGVVLSLRKHQRVPLTQKPHDHVFVLVSGVVLVEAKLPERPRQVLEILYPGDVFHAQDAPDTLGAALVAATTAEVQRFRPDVFAVLERNNVEFSQRIASAAAMRSARRTLHLASLSGQTGEERLADFLVEIGLFLGRDTPGGRSVDLPLTREETADFLSLNPDTLSRIFSRLKHTGLISVSRGRATVPDWQALARLSPLAGALTELAAKAPHR